MWWTLGGDAPSFCKQDLKTTRQHVCQSVVLSQDVQTNPWPWLKSTAERLVAREILVTRDATKTAFSSLCIPVSSLRAMLWIVLSTLSHLVCLSVADGAIASESWFPGGRDSRACYYSCVGRGALPNQVWMLSDEWIRAIAAMLQDFGPQSAESVEETVKQDLDVQKD